MIRVVCCLQVLARAADPLSVQRSHYGRSDGDTLLQALKELRGLVEGSVCKLGSSLANPNNNPNTNTPNTIVPNTNNLNANNANSGVSVQQPGFFPDPPPVHQPSSDPRVQERVADAMVHLQPHSLQVGGLLCALFPAPRLVGGGQKQQLAMGAAGEGSVMRSVPCRWFNWWSDEWSL